MENPFLQLEADKFNCIHIDYDKELHTADVKVLEAQLEDAIKHWRVQGVKAVWAKVKRLDSIMIQSFINQQFIFHHTRPDYLLMHLWLLEDVQFNLPGYATQHLGAGGFVIDEVAHPNQLLVVQELHGREIWKLPGGLADEGESIEDACVREVFEETGIKCAFLGILGFRQQHGFHFGCSDIYFACLVTPKCADQQIRMQESEIKRCEWMDIDAFIALPTTGELCRAVVRAYKLYREKQLAISQISTSPLRSCFSISTIENRL